MARILIVDDDVDYRNWLLSVLGAPEHEIQCESDADRALALISGGSYDLAILNIELDPRESDDGKVRRKCLIAVYTAVSRGTRALVVTSGSFMRHLPADYDMLEFLKHDYHSEILWKRQLDNPLSLVQKVRSYVSSPLPALWPPNTLLDLGWAAAAHRFPWHGSVDAEDLYRRWQEQNVNLLDVVFVEKIGRIINATCRIERANGNPDGDGTGFAVAPNLILTCSHVVPKGVKPGTYRARFRFRYSSTGVLDPGHTYWIKGVVRSSHTDKLDFSLLEVVGEPGNEPEIGYIKLARKVPAMGDLAFIVQYPKRKPQKICLFHNWVEWVDANRVQYLTHTEHGASGAPVFDRNGDILALHHAETETPAPNLPSHIRGSEGIPINAILTRVRDILP